MTDFHVSYIQFPQEPSGKLIAEVPQEDSESNIKVLPPRVSSLHLPGFSLGEIDSDGGLWLKEVLGSCGSKGSSTSLHVAFPNQDDPLHHLWACTVKVCKY